MRTHLNSLEAIDTTPVLALVLHHSPSGHTIATRHMIEKTHGQYALGTGSTVRLEELEQLNRTCRGTPCGITDCP